MNQLFAMGFIDQAVLALVQMFCLVICVFFALFYIAKAALKGRPEVKDRIKGAAVEYGTRTAVNVVGKLFKK